MKRHNPNDKLEMKRNSATNSQHKRNRKRTEAELDAEFERNRTTWRIAAQIPQQPWVRLLWSEKFGFVRETLDAPSGGPVLLYHDRITPEAAKELLLFSFVPEEAQECLASGAPSLNTSIRREKRHGDMAPPFDPSRLSLVATLKAGGNRLCWAEDTGGFVCNSKTGNKRVTLEEATALLLANFAPPVAVECVLKQGSHFKSN